MFCGPKSYLRSGWRILDCATLVLCGLDLGLTGGARLA